tara:strand:- start:8483 stop:9967 length:1485 start_codon:yes stop_codon:yes gene_type:complete
MGLPIEKENFTKADYDLFSARLHAHLETLSTLLDEPDFGLGEQTFGAELEMSIVDSKLNPSLISHHIIQHANDPLLQHELNQYNLEYNLSPVRFQNKPFSMIHQEMSTALNRINQQCAQFDSQAVTIGILPILKKSHISKDFMTNEKRYHALSNITKELKNGKFKLNINGVESLQMENDDLTLEGANTSFQVQLKVPPHEFVDLFNAIQIASPLAIALGANSPTLMNKILWDETRITLFKQTVDCRRDDLYTEWRQPNRVPFGYGWLRQSALECFAENVCLYPPLLPICKPKEMKPNKNDGPDLFELKVQQGVVWHWNRAIYDEADGGHLRIELRTLPSGPTKRDMLANAAFLIGLSYAIKKNINKFLVSFPFMFAEYNFYRASKHGLQAELIWPLTQEDYSQARPVVDILQYYFPMVKESLLEIGIAQEEVKWVMDIIEARSHNKQNGANWQKELIYKFEHKHSREEAVKLMFEQYIKNSLQDKPVHEWSKEI